MNKTSKSTNYMDTISPLTLHDKKWSEVVWHTQRAMQFKTAFSYQIATKKSDSLWTIWNTLKSLCNIITTDKRLVCLQKWLLLNSCLCREIQYILHTIMYSTLSTYCSTVKYSPVHIAVQYSTVHIEIQHILHTTP